MNNFYKNPIQSITNENIRAKIKKSIDLTDIDDNMIIMHLTNYN